MRDETRILSEIADPIEFYRYSLKEAHSSQTGALFEKLCQEAKIDKEANRALIASLKIVEATIRDMKERRFRAICLIIFCFLLTLYIFYCIGTVPEDFARDPTKIMMLVFLVVGILGLWFGIYRLLRTLNKIGERLSDAKSAAEKKRALAWAQMAPLNKLFKWDMGFRLIERVLPILRFDNFLHEGRLHDLEKNFGLHSDYGQNASFLETCSGSLLEYPFIFARYLEHFMGVETYYGSRTIHWTEREKDAQGNWQSVKKSQTLTASVTKAYPRYRVNNFLIYGHDAAPHLSFSRKPSSLSSLGDDWLSQKRKKWAERRLEKKSLKSKGNFTAMTNREFDAMFGAHDRTHETEFRLLFTPLAQQNMQKLLQNKEAVGYGDNFTFQKRGKLNILTSKQLDQMDIKGDVNFFRGYDFAEIAHNFINAQRELMRGIYFSLAPLFTIPLYLEKRVKCPNYVQRGTQAERKASLWEVEVMANIYGEDSFKHPESCTKNILKAVIKAERDGTQKVIITARGFRKKQHVSSFSVHGDDGKYHQVLVTWYEYLPVEKISEMLISPDKNALKGGTGLKYRRGLFFALRK